MLQASPKDLVVAVYGRTSGGWIEVAPQLALPRHLRGPVEALGEYQYLAADAAWEGDRTDAIRALCANPLVRTQERARSLYGELAAAHAAYLPARLL